MENEIKQNIPTTQSIPQSPSHVPSSSNTSWLKVLLLFGLGLIIALVSLLTGVQIGKNQTSNLQSIVLPPTASPTQIIATLTIQPTAFTATSPSTNVKTYTNDEYKFSFMYPSDWKLNCLATKIPDNWLERNICDLVSPRAQLDHGQIFNGSYFVISVGKPDRNYSNFSEFLDYSGKQFGYTYKDMQINNINGKVASVKGKETNYLFERNGHFINLSWLYSENSDSVKEILSTFKLIN